nr:hypothetical protein [Tanacetum cinerariifolium]
NTSGSDRPRHPVLQIWWGVVTGTNIDYAELIWEEFVQAIKTFFSNAANFRVQPKILMAARKPRQATSVMNEEGGKKKKDPPVDTEILNVDEEQGKEVSNTMALEERTIELDEGQAGSNLGKTPESRLPPEGESIEEDKARPNPRQSHVA